MNSKVVICGCILSALTILHIYFMQSCEGSTAPQIRSSPIVTTDFLNAFKNITFQMSNIMNKVNVIINNTNNSNNNNNNNNQNNDDVKTKLIVKSKEENKPNKFNSIELLETIQTERKTTLKKACKRLQFNNVCSSNEKSINKHLLYSNNYKLISCDVLKCGYSNWLRAFFHIENRGDEYKSLYEGGAAVIKRSEELFRITSISDNILRQKVFDESLKVILVRHPFSRIISGYNDKMVPTTDGYSYYYGPISKKINRNYRHLRQNVTERNQSDDGNAKFEDFINFIIRLKYFDAHWKPVRDLCNPCTSQYDYIAKMETVNNDMEYLKQKLNLTEEHRKNFFPKHKYRSDVDLMKKMFKTIPKQLTRQLYGVYKQDFEMFGYEFPDWLC